MIRFLFLILDSDCPNFQYLSLKNPEFYLLKKLYDNLDSVPVEAETAVMGAVRNLDSVI